MEGLAPAQWTDGWYFPSFCWLLPLQYAVLTRADEEIMRDLVPGGYLFTHMVFWSVVALIGIGTQAVAIILSVGVVLLIVEALQAR